MSAMNWDMLDVWRTGIRYKPSRVLFGAGKMVARPTLTDGLLIHNTSSMLREVPIPMNRTFIIHARNHPSGKVCLGHEPLIHFLYFVFCLGWEIWYISFIRPPNVTVAG